MLLWKASFILVCLIATFFFFFRSQFILALSSRQWFTSPRVEITNRREKHRTGAVLDEILIGCLHDGTSARTLHTVSTGEGLYMTNPFVAVTDWQYRDAETAYHATSHMKHSSCVSLIAI